MSHRSPLALSLTLLSLSSSTLAGGTSAPQGTLWVADEGSGSLTVVDAATNRVRATLKGVPAPHNVQLSPDSKSAWAVLGQNAQAVKIDAVSLRVLGSVPTGAAPAHVIVSPDGKRAYVTNGEAGSVSIIDALTLKPLTTVTVGSHPTA